MNLSYCAATLLFASVFLAGCGRDDMKVYHVAKDDSAAPPKNQIAAPVPTGNSQPQLQFVLPDGWQEKAPSQMRVASFTVTGSNGGTADVGVIPLPTGGDELALVNMWRDQMQLPALTNETAAEKIYVGNDSAKLFDIASDALLIDGKSRARILVAELPRGATSWFFKMTGEDSFVAAQKENFLQFLKSISFVENSSPQIASVPAPENPNANSIWTIPSDWRQLPPSQFLLAEFSIAGANDAQAEVNVAELSGEGGGLLANVNRWRGQIGLGAVGENDLPQLAQSVDVPNGKATLVDLAGVNAQTGAQVRLVGAIVPQNGQTWFYKLMGDEQIVAQQKDAFIKFIQSADYSNAR